MSAVVARGLGMRRHYPLALDTIDDKDIDRLIRWLKRGPRLTQGTVVAEFESAWSRWAGRKYSVFCNSGSSANLLSYYALLLSGRLKNNKVIVPAVGWVTSIAPAIQFGFKPIMCEADPDTFGLDLGHLERLLKRHNPATVVLVQVLGVAHKMREMMALKKRYGFHLIEDACAAIGAEYKGKRVGSFGELASFSFYFGHQMSTIEGGMVSTDDARLDSLLRMARAHGWSKDLDRATQQRLVRRYKVDDFNAPFVFYHPGFNVRSTDLNAYIGLGQLAKLDWIIRRREENHARYLHNLQGRFYAQRPEPGSRVCSIHFGMLTKDVEERKTIVKALTRHGIETRMFSAGNLGLHPFWSERYGRASFPMADRIHHCGMFLPNHPSLKVADIDHISQVVLNAVKKI